MRYVLNFNPEGSEILSNGLMEGSVEFRKLPKPLKSGATTAVRFARNGEGVSPLSPRDEYCGRFGTAINEKIARKVGLRGSRRYTLQRAGSSNWFNLVPHSAIVRSKARHIDGPGVSVSIIER